MPSHNTDAGYTITRHKNWSSLNISCAQCNPSISSFKDKTLSYPTIETLINEPYNILKKLPIENLGVRKFMILALVLFGKAMT